MSHFSRVKTRFKNRDALIECLEDAEFSIRQDTTIRGYRGLQNVDIAARAKNGSEIGFVKNSDGSFDMVADWWTKTGRGEQQLARSLQVMAEKVQQDYARRMVLEQARNDGFSVVEETEEKDGSIRIVVRRWVP
ncbi:MAG: hypothetical protein A4E35_02041 [Methanoregula sp. PtaU1.Bin051]|nr:MAG: hypothetical protein A4E35_02041 [Methanoregula sp. PtaU1.Bin051]